MVKAVTDDSILKCVTLPWTLDSTAGQLAKNIYEAA